MYEIFEKLCKEKGVTPYRVSEETGIKTSALSSWKAGRSTPKYEKMRMIANYFSVPTEYLMTGVMPDTEEQYYSPEAKEIMQDIHDREDLRALFHVAKKSSPEYVEMVRDLLEKLVAKEESQD